MWKVSSRTGALLASGCLWVGMAQAQESVNASGGIAKGSEGSLSYSIGQVVYTTNHENTGSLSQGVQQPYEVFTSDTKDLTPEPPIVLFPNPTNDDLFLMIRDRDVSPLSFFLCDSNGKVILHRKITSELTEIDLDVMPTATYFLQVMQSGKENVRSFQIIKN